MASAVEDLKDERVPPSLYWSVNQTADWIEELGFPYYRVSAHLKVFLFFFLLILLDSLGSGKVREESFITRWGGRLHFHVVGKHFDDPPPNPVGKTYSTPPPPIYDKNICDPPPQPAQPPKHHCFFLLL